MTKAILHPSGVYAVKNTIDEKRYVGSSVDIPSRFVTHRSKLRNDKHHSVKLQNAWNKYGEECFVLEILEEVADHKLLKQTEQKWMDCFKSYDKNLGYNVAHTAENGNRGMKQTPEFIARRTASLKGQKRTPEQRERNAEAHRGKRLGPQSEEVKAKKSEAMKRYRRTPEHQEKLNAANRAYATTPEARAANSARQKGRRPSDETRVKQKEAARRRWDSATPEEREIALRNLEKHPNRKAA